MAKLLQGIRNMLDVEDSMGNTGPVEGYLDHSFRCQMNWDQNVDTELVPGEGGLEEVRRLEDTGQEQGGTCVGGVRGTQEPDSTEACRNADKEQAELQ